MTAITHLCDLNPIKSKHRQIRSTAKNKSLKSPWSYGRAYIPAFGILLLLLLSLGVLHLHQLGSNLLQVRIFKKQRIVAGKLDARSLEVTSEPPEASAAIYPDIKENLWEDSLSTLFREN